MQDPKGRENVVFRIHLVRWHHHQLVRVKVPIRSHVEIKEMDLLLGPVSIQKGFHLTSQDGSPRAFPLEGLLRSFRGKLRSGRLRQEDRIEDQCAHSKTTFSPAVRDS